MVGLLGPWNRRVRELDPPPVEDSRRTPRTANDHERRPAGMRPKAERGVHQPMHLGHHYPPLWAKDYSRKQSSHLFKLGGPWGKKQQGPGFSRALVYFRDI